MLKPPPMSEILEEGQSRYSLVIGVAKRARKIAEEDPTKIKKPVTQAVEEFMDKKVRMTEIRS